jgi:hypothetical protein
LTFFSVCSARKLALVISAKAGPEMPVGGPGRPGIGDPISHVALPAFIDSGLSRRSPGIA